MMMVVAELPLKEERREGGALSLRVAPRPAMPSLPLRSLPLA